MSVAVVEVGLPKNITATGQVYTGRCQLLGFMCSSSTSGTVKLWDNTSAAGTVIVDTVAVAAGTYYKVPSICINGIYATIGGTAANITLYVNPLN